MFESLFAERGLSLDRLKVLIEVRDAGSIALAAPDDPVRQSQYSRQLRELSEFFGCEVAHRRGKRLKLTEQGERLAELAREQLRSLDDFRAECREQAVAFTLGAGDSLIQWLVIPRLGAVVDAFPGTHFSTVNLRTNDIVRQIDDGRLDFGIVRRNAMAPGLKAVSLGTVRYVALIPATLLTKRTKPALAAAFENLPLATQTTDGQFTEGLRSIAKALDVQVRPALSCQSFPQALAAARSGRFWSIVPELALRSESGTGLHRLEDPTLRVLDREAMLAWNPRLARVRPKATRIATSLQHALKID